MAVVPMVQVGRVVIATFGDELDDQSALDLQTDLGERVVAARATGVLLDISSLEIVDSFICRVLGETARVVEILGARVAIIGMQPAVAITLVELGLPLDGIATGRTLDHGFQLLAASPAKSTWSGGQRRDGRG